MYKCVNGLLPRTFSSYFTSVHDTHKHHARWHNNLFLQFTRTSYSIHTLRHYGQRLWNSIDLSIKSKSSVSQFKTSYESSCFPVYDHGYDIAFFFRSLIILNLFSFWIVLFSSNHSPFRLLLSSLCHVSVVVCFMLRHSSASFCLLWSCLHSDTLFYVSNLFFSFMYELRPGFDSPHQPPSLTGSLRPHQVKSVPQFIFKLLSMFIYLWYVDALLAMPLL